MKQHGKTASYFIIVLKRWLLLMAGTLGVGIILGLLLGYVRTEANSRLFSVFGWAGIVLTGVVGTPVHELSHLIMCLLFGIKVNEVALFRPVAGKADGILGYVNYAYNPENHLEKLGTFFVGVAPMLLGVGIIILVLRLLTPEVYATIKKKLAGVKSNPSYLYEKKAKKLLMTPLRLYFAAISGFFSGMFILRKWGILRGIIMFYIVCSIAMHLELSAADLNGALVGFLLIALIMLLVCAAVSLTDADFEAKIAALSSYIALYLSFGITLCCVVLVISRLLIMILL